MPDTKFEKIKSLDKALRILDCVSDAANGVGVTEVSTKLGINKATVSKMLSTMSTHHIVTKNKRTRRYQLGYRLLDFGTRFLGSIDLRADAWPHLKALEQSINETVNLAVCYNSEVFYVDKFEGANSPRLTSRVGASASLTCTAVGKILFTYMSESERYRLEETTTPEKRTSRSLTKWDDIKTQCQEIRERGYALDVEENEDGVICIGAPIFDYLRQVVGAVSITCLASRCDPKTRLVFLRDKLLEVCKKISAEEGYHLRN